MDERVARAEAAYKNQAPIFILHHRPGYLFDQEFVTPRDHNGSGRLLMARRCRFLKEAEDGEEKTDEESEENAEEEEAEDRTTVQLVHGSQVVDRDVTGHGRVRSHKDDSPLSCDTPVNHLGTVCLL